MSTATAGLYTKHKTLIDNAIKAVHERKFYAQYPEHPKPYGEDAPKTGLDNFQKMLNNPFNELLQKDTDGFVGEEQSPYTQEKLGITYPSISVSELTSRAQKAADKWKNSIPEDRAGILVEALESIKDKFFEIAYATMHTTGQSFMMSFQASGPHSNDRALEAIAIGLQETTRFPNAVQWVKPMGKFDLELSKKYKAIPKGVGLVIGCSTFPVWNTVPGVFANLIAGNTVIVKPHPKAILAAAIVVAQMQKAFKENGVDPEIVQLAVDTPSKMITKDLAEHEAINLIDYTGNSEFGNYLEKLPNKTVFTEKTGVNSVILDSMEDLEKVLGNLAFSVSLYSGQMCTAPQNFFVPENGLNVNGEQISYDEVVAQLKANVTGLVENPKVGPGTLGAVQNPDTVTRVQNVNESTGKMVLESKSIENPEFANARTCAPAILEVEASNKDAFSQELFGPVILVVKTKDTAESVALARDLAKQHGAITCAAYTTDENTMNMIEREMEKAFTPVSFNLTGFIWVNQHAAFSDFHVTGGNPAGNATYVNPEYLIKRFVWVGHRRLV